MSFATSLASLENDMNIGFSFLAGAWELSSMLMMVGAVAVAIGAYVLARRRATAWLG